MSMTLSIAMRVWCTPAEYPLLKRRKIDHQIAVLGLIILPEGCDGDGGHSDLIASLVRSRMISVSPEWEKKMATSPFCRVAQAVR
jgi:hypothetical protein